jgi:hypothetical protein
MNRCPVDLALDSRELTDAMTLPPGAAMLAFFQRRSPNVMLGFSAISSPY